MIDLALLQRTLGQDRTVSDRSLSRLRQFESLVRKWNPAINVVARSTIDDVWHRHILDSAQLFGFARPEHRVWLDIGSGGGFPGVVIAILASDLLPDLHVGLVESDRRKAVFLSEAIRQLGLQTVVHTARVEDLAPQMASVVSARALAPLSTLCGFAARHLAEEGACAFLKGANCEDEISEARISWRFDLDRIASITDSRASVLFLRGLKHV